ncbi:MAG: nicotinate (nicotinamide) nucleotide adenylyltransferase [Deltaproteobacteria bacterium RBG_13_47_9]|nr:MAG: nicotinate (nicotinamide) nucleotide adenylyltransferase [Deltaproteobacteria bacterium RBG_13_47_9]
MSEQAKKEGKNKRIGLFGGTFNPIHLGHLRGAEEIRETFALQEVIFIPAAISPHKAAEEVIDAKHRLEMVRRATATNPYFSATEIELLRFGKSYSIDTLRYFREKYQDPLYFILGRDAFVEIETWREFESLFSLCHFVVMTSPGFQKNVLSSPLPEGLTSVFRYDPGVNAWIHQSGQTLIFKEITFLDISSTKIRELTERGASLRYLVPMEVETYVKQHGLYQKKQ